MDRDAVGRIEEFRSAYVFAHDNKAYGRWKTRQRHPSATWGPGGRGLSGAALERRIMGLKLAHPDLVAMPGEKVRRMRKSDMPPPRIKVERARRPRKVSA